MCGDDDGGAPGREPGSLAGARDDAEFESRARALASDALGPVGAPRIEGHRIVGVINAGTQGVVYRAVQESTHRVVAIKVLAGGEHASARQRARAEREAEIAARLRHPNVVTVHESRTLADGRIAVVMEFVDGVPIDRWEGKGATPAERLRAALRVFVSACAGVHHAHLNGVIHRDLKPDNILVTGEGRAVVLDFGIAQAGGIRTTSTGEFAGTPAYASPEQVSGRPLEVDALTDVYALGVILYRLLCGAEPYELRGSLIEMARTIEQTPPTPPRVRNPSIAPDLEAIALCALRKEKHGRYQSAAAFGRDVERYLAGEAIEARSGSGWYQLRKAVSANRARLAAIGAVLLVLVVASGAIARSTALANASARRAERQRVQARAEALRAEAVATLLAEALPAPDPARPDVARAVSAGLRRLYLRLEAGDFADDPDLDQAIRRIWGGLYGDVGRGRSAGLIEYAEVSLRSGLERLRLSGERESEAVAATLHGLAGVLRARQRLSEAEPICAEAIEMRVSLLGDESGDAAESRVLMALILHDLGRSGEADTFGSRAREQFDADGSLRADAALGALALAESRSALREGRVGDAESSAIEALERRLRRLQPDDRELLAALAHSVDVVELAPGGRLAALLRDAWGGEDLRASVTRDLAVLSTPAPGIIHEPRDDGRTLALRRVLTLQEAMLGADSPAITRTLLAMMNAADAERMSEVKVFAALRALDLLSRRWGEVDAHLMVCLEEASYTLATSGRAAEGAPLAGRIVEIRDALPVAARDPLLLANARRVHAWMLSMAGRCDEAEGVFLTAEREMIETLGEAHYLVALTRAQLAYCVLERGDVASAEAMSRAALETLVGTAISSTDQRAHGSFVRGRVLAAQGRHAEALELFETAWSSFYNVTPRENRWRMELLEGLSGSCEAAGDLAGAEGWRRVAAGG